MTAPNPIGALALLSVMVGGAGWAAEPATVEEAAARAEAAMAVKHYAEAAEHMERAYALGARKLPVALANAGYARMLAGQQDRAVELLSAALGDRRLVGADRDNAVQRLGRASSTRAFVLRASEARARGDLAAAARALDEALAQVAIGPYALEAAGAWEAAGELELARQRFETAAAAGDLGPDQQQAALAGAERVRTAVAAKVTKSEPAASTVVTPETVATEPVVAPVGAGAGAWPWVVAGGGVAALGAGIVLVVLAEGERGDVEAAVARLEAGEEANMTREEAVRAEADADGLATAGVIVSGVGAALAVGGIVWVLVDGGGPETRGRVNVGWAPAAGGGFLTATGRF